MISEDQAWTKTTVKEARNLTDTHLVWWRPYGVISVNRTSDPDYDLALVISTQDKKEI